MIDEPGNGLSRAVAEEIRRAREEGAGVVLDIGGCLMLVPASEVQLSAEAPKPGLWDRFRRAVAARPVDPELSDKLRRIISQAEPMNASLCSASGWVGAHRPLDVWREDPERVLEAVGRAVELDVRRSRGRSL